MTGEPFRGRDDDDRAYQRWVAPHFVGPAESPDGLNRELAGWGGDDPDGKADNRADDSLEPRAEGDAWYRVAAGSLAGAIVGAIVGVWVAVQWLDEPTVATDGPWVALLAFAAAGGSIAGVALSLAALFLLPGPSGRSGSSGR